MNGDPVPRAEHAASTRDKLRRRHQRLQIRYLTPTQGDLTGDHVRASDSVFPLESRGDIRH